MPNANDQKLAELQRERAQCQKKAEQMDSMIQYVSNSREQYSRQAISNLVEAVRRLPDEPFDPRTDPSCVEYARQRDEAISRASEITAQLATMGVE